MELPVLCSTTAKAIYQKKYLTLQFISNSQNASSISMALLCLSFNPLSLFLPAITRLRNTVSNKVIRNSISHEVFYPLYLLEDLLSISVPFKEFNFQILLLTLTILCELLFLFLELN